MGIAEALRQRIRAEASDRCGYCLSPQKLVLGVLEIEHIQPVSRGGTDAEENLWVACRTCNLAKGSQVDALDPLSGTRAPLFNLRTQLWWDHFAWSESAASVVGLTPIGRATVIALALNNSVSIRVRRNWVLAGWHPPLT
jgi:hypothetical protein